MVLARSKISGYKFLYPFLLILFAGYFALVRKNPLVSTLGVESANLLILVFGPLFCFASAFFFVDKQEHLKTRLVKNYLLGGVFFSVSSLTFFINGFFEASCSPSKGLFAFTVVFLIPFLWNISFGTLVSFLPRAWQKIVSLSAFFLGYIFWVGFLKVKYNYFRVMTHFSVVIPSDVLEGIVLEPEIVLFRVASACFLLALLALLCGLKKEGRYLGLLMFMVFSFLGYKTQSYAQEGLGKNKSALVQTYSLSLTKANITIKANSALTSKKTAQAMLQEALFWQKRLEKRIGFKSKKSITIWLHASSNMQALYTGAKNVHFAQPLEGEIHIHGTNIPHATLGHELAHIYLGELSPNLLGMLGPYYMVPNFALNEGLATALSLEERAYMNMDIFSYARALYHTGSKVNIRKLFSPFNFYFFQISSSVSYTYAGAFLAHCINSIPNPQDFIKAVAKKGQLSGFFSKEEIDSMVFSFERELRKKPKGFEKVWVQRYFTKSSVLSKSCPVDEKQEVENFFKELGSKDVQEFLKASTKNQMPKRASILRGVGQKLIQQDRFYEATKVYEYLLEDEGMLTENSKSDCKQVLGKLYLVQKEYRKASQILDTLNVNNLLPYEKRSRFLQKHLFKNYFQSGSEQSLSALNFLLSFEGQYDKNSNKFSYFISKNRHEDGQNIAERYLWFKLQVALSNNQLALSIGNMLKEEIYALEEDIVEEFHFSLAKLYLTLDDKNSAKELFLRLLNSATHGAQKTIYQDYYERSIS